MKCVGYVRISRSEELGPQVQRDAITEWATKNGHTIESWHEDIGLSGARAAEDRPGLFAALSALKALGKGCALVVHKRDRLARDVAVASATEAMVERYKCRVMSTDGVGAGTDTTAKLMRGLFDLLAEWERGVIRVRTKSALAVKKARGERISGKPPWGFQFSAGRVIPHPAEQATRARAAELRSQGLSVRAVVRRLKSEGHQGREGRPVTYRTVAS